MASNDLTAPNVSYSFVTHASIDGATGPLAITGASLNEVRKAVRLLQANNLLVATPPAASAASVDRCPTHSRELKASKKPGVKFCPAQNEDGSYCSFKVKG